MACFGLVPSRARPTPTSTPPPPPPPSPPPSGTVSSCPPSNPTDDVDDDEDDVETDWSRTRAQSHSQTSSGPQTSTASSHSTTINLTHEFSRAMHTNSYNEIWSKIFHPAPEISQTDPNSSSHLIAHILDPDRASVQDALRTARPTPLNRLASRYFESSELTTHLCLSLHRAVDEARALYAPVALALDLLPHPLRLSPDQCDWAFDRLHEFLNPNNPFPASQSFDAFRDMRNCFSDLRAQLDRRLSHARRRHRLLRRSTTASAACLVVSLTAVSIAVLALTTHAIAALVAGPALLIGIPPPLTRDLLAGPRRRLRERISRMDAAARGAYVLNNDLDTIEQLVAGLHAAVESDRALVRLGLERGRGQRHLIEEVLRHLRSSQPRFLHQLKDLDEHVCICFATVNRARSLLLHHIYHAATQDSNDS